MIKIILVDDEPTIVKGLCANIEKLGPSYRVAATCNHPHEVSNAVEKTKPDLIFLDIQMPQVDGLSLARSLKKKHPQIDIVFLTGYADFSFAQEALRLGASDYLLKPIKRADLLRVLQSVSHKVNDTYATHQHLCTCEGNVLHFSTGTIARYCTEGKVLNDTAVRPIVAKTVQLINLHFGEDMSLKQVANRLFVNSSYLSEAFKSDVGLSFSNYVTFTRLENARHLILNHPELKVYEVAKLVGIDDARYFSQMFKKYLGVTPATYHTHNI